MQPSRRGDEKHHPCFRAMRRHLLATTAMASSSVEHLAGGDRIGYGMGMFSCIALANQITRLLTNDFSGSRGEVTVVESLVVVAGIFILLLIGFGIASIWWPAVALTPLRVLGLALASPVVLVAYIVLVVIPFSR